MTKQRILQHDFRNLDYAVANNNTTHHAALKIAQDRIDQKKS
jgi:hypothetical protein